MLVWKRSRIDPKNRIEAEFLPGLRYVIVRSGRRYRVIHPLMAQYDVEVGTSKEAKSRCEENLKSDLQYILFRSKSFAHQRVFGTEFMKSVYGLPPSILLRVIEVFARKPSIKWDLDRALELTYNKLERNL